MNPKAVMRPVSAVPGSAWGIYSVLFRSFFGSGRNGFTLHLDAQDAKAAFSTSTIATKLPLAATRRTSELQFHAFLVPAQQGIGAACVAERIRGIEDFLWLSLPAR